MRYLPLILPIFLQISAKVPAAVGPAPPYSPYPLIAIKIDEEGGQQGKAYYVTGAIKPKELIACSNEYFLNKVKNIAFIPSNGRTNVLSKAEKEGNEDFNTLYGKYAKRNLASKIDNAATLKATDKNYPCIIREKEGSLRLDEPVQVQDKNGQDNIYSFLFDAELDAMDLASIISSPILEAEGDHAIPAKIMDPTKKDREFYIFLIVHYKFMLGLMATLGILSLLFVYLLPSVEGKEVVAFVQEKQKPTRRRRRVRGEEF